LNRDGPTVLFFRGPILCPEMPARDV